MFEDGLKFCQSMISNGQSWSDDVEWNDSVEELCDIYKVTNIYLICLCDLSKVGMILFVLQVQADADLSSQFYATYLLCLDRLTCGVLRKSEVSSSLVVTLLRKMDNILSEFDLKGLSSKYTSHFGGQLYLSCARLVLNNLNCDQKQEYYYNKLQNAAVFLRRAYAADICAEFWVDGCARRAMSARLLELVRSKIMTEGIEVPSLTLYHLIFGDTNYDASQSYIMRRSNHIPIHFVNCEDMHQYETEFLIRHGSDLKLIVWYLMRYVEEDAPLSKPVKLPWEYCDTENSMDISSFLYAVLYSAVWRSKYDFLCFDPHVIHTTKDQDYWWKLAMIVFNDGLLGELDTIFFKQGIGMIGSLSSHVTNPKLVMYLGSTFAMNASKSNDQNLKECAEQRAVLYYQAFLQSTSTPDIEWQTSNVDKLAFFEKLQYPLSDKELEKMSQTATGFLEYMKLRKNNSSSLISNEVVRVEQDNEYLIKFSPSTAYIQWLYERVIKQVKSSTIGVCQVRGKDANIQIPYFSLCMIWPVLKDIVIQCPETLTSLDISIPDLDATSLDIVPMLLTSGFVSGSLTLVKSAFELDIVKGLDLSIEKACPIEDVGDTDDDDFQIAVDNCIFESEDDKTFLSVPNEVFVTSHCSKSCTNHCSRVVDRWPEEVQKTLISLFKCERKFDTRQLLLNHLVSQQNHGLSLVNFIVFQHEFCTKYLSMKTEISEYIIKSVLKDFHEGVRVYMHGNLGSLQPTRYATMNAITWIKSFSEAYGQFSPEENVTVLSYWLNKRALYTLYLDEVPKPHVSQSTFYSLFKEKFGPNRSDKTLPWIRISKDSTHSICSICVALNNAQRQCKSESELNIVRELRNNHKMNFGEARRKVGEIRQSSQSFPSDHLFIQLGRKAIHYLDSNF